ncbi:MSCRAMM family protein [Engelhardtia mirabilis]|uniref:PEGA domain protein n=1 Tax=Engelhardtia mirabilis TaxID=2528011 RepID=A0A518BNZ5_9BACT|nr:PEGA domain protein [Planctomycetes bacterium Pla133]QDV03024.1 PEGA domain protein [Planctomycetes bacterium Pla86]
MARGASGDGDRRGGDVLERNVERLLRRAWRPVEVSPDFRASLERRFVERAAQRWAPVVERPRYSAVGWAILAAAAALALLLGAGALLDGAAAPGGVGSGNDLALSDPGSTLGDGQSAGSPAEAADEADEIGSPRDFLAGLLDSVGDRRRLPAIPGINADGADEATDAASGEAEDPARLSIELSLPQGGPQPSSVRAVLLRSAQLPDVVDPILLPAWGGDEGSEAPDTTRRRTFSELDAGRHTLHVFAGGYAPWRGEVDLRPGGLLEVDVQLELGGRARGEVLDAATGAPIEGALILSEEDLPLQVIDAGLDRERDREVPAVVARSDAAGAFELAPLSTGKHRLRATAPGHAPVWIEVEIGARAAEDLRFELPAGGTVFGRTADEFGRPRVGAVVVSSYFESPGGTRKGFYGAAITDERGEYRIDGLPAGIHVVLLFETSEPEAPSAMLPLVLPAGGQRRVDFVPHDNGVALSGIVVDALGAPLAGHVITLSRSHVLESDAAVGDDDGIASWSAVTTDGEGRFRFERVAPGEYALYGAPKAGSEMVLYDEVDLRAGLDRSVRMSVGSASLGGRVTAADDGSPVPDSTLLLLCDDDRGRLVFAGRQLTGADGRFAFDGVRPRDYRLLVVPARPDLAATLVEDVRVELGVERTTLELTLEPGGTIEVECRDLEGRPIADVDVDLIDAGGLEVFDDGRFRTGPDGLSVIESVADGRWTVRVQAPGFARAERTILAVAGQTRRVEVTLVLDE